ncbi:MAG: glycosyltransferase family 2 protein [Pseudomonadota bacterium]|nr:glycosyltransferase family 2 protein [Pseudomonadota bacterium]
MKRISFIMPSFNRAGYIAESIESVHAQMQADDELLVVDDGSTDDTESAVAPYLDRLRYVRQDNAGKAAALNRAMGMTSGAYVWI